MKRSSIILSLALFASLLLLGSGAPQGEDALRKYVKSIQGTWISLPDYSAEIEAERPDLLIHIDPVLIKDGQVRIVVSDYCGEAQADYLHFELQGERLKYVGASQDACFFDMTRLDFVYLSFEVEGQDTLLVYEAQETEYANYQYHKLLRMPAADLDAGWACRLQGYLTTFLRKGSYQICDANGCELSLSEAFGSEDIIADMSFANEHPVLFPGLEELGVSTPFDIVMIGSVHPAGKATIYAIEWRKDAIYLYETYHEYDELHKGNLRFVLMPDFVKPTDFQALN
ncbi:MAG: hypothetical protein AAFN10_05165 [Bacteroidota bacterium]